MFVGGKDAFTVRLERVVVFQGMFPFFRSTNLQSPVFQCFS